MKFAVASLLGLLCSVGASPVEKVVQLITDVKDRAIADGETEQKMYNKYACWCETTAKRKAGAITDAQDLMRALGQQILSLKGKIATRTAEIAELADGIRKNQDAQELATSIREKENADYMAEASETKQALAALEQAVQVLVKGSAAEEDKRVTAPVLVQESSLTIRALLETLPMSLHLKAQQVSLLSEFAQAGSDAKKYAPQSATIQGILSDMYSTFATDLEGSTNDEATANRKFEDYIHVKQIELGDMESTKQTKEEQKAEAESLLADTTQNYDDTEEQKKADIEFFDETKDVCTTNNEAWVIRKDLREEEIKGMKEALEILTSDEARELFAEAIKPGKETGMGDHDSGEDISFLQTESDNSVGAPAQHAFMALKAAATKSHSLRLAQLAASVKSSKSGHFDAVIGAIDQMIQLLKDEETADIDKKQQCKDKFTEIESTVKDLDWKIEKNEAKIDKLEKLIVKHDTERLKTIDEIDDVEAQMLAMQAQRKEGNEAFLAAKSDDSHAIDLLKQAREALSKYYKANKIEMVQLKKPFAVSDDQAPEFKLAGKGSRAGESKGIVSLMTMLIEDLNDEIKNGMKNEEQAQLDFEKEMETANKLRDELIEKRTNLEDTIAKRQQDKIDENADMTVNMKDRLNENNYKAEIKPDCDWIIRAFADRDVKREAEMNGLVTAKEYLAGAKVPSMLQLPKLGEDSLSRIRFLGMRK